MVLEVEMSEVGVYEQHSSMTETTQSNYSDTYFTFRHFKVKEKRLREHWGEAKSVQGHE